MNSIEDLLGVTQKVEDDNKGTKFKTFKNKATLYIKELKYPISLVVALTVVGVASKYTLLDDESQYSMKYMYGSGKDEVEQLEQSVHSLLSSTNSMQNDLVLVNSQIAEKRKELDEANATITNLTQGYYFIAYLDSLFNKHGVTLDKFDINLQLEGYDGKIITVNNLVDVQIPKGDYSLLPLDIEFTASSEAVRKLFNEFYTRRIVYDKNLQVLNNLDNSVTVKTKIEFTNSTDTGEVAGANTPEMQTDPALSVEQVPADGSVPTDQGVPTETPSTNVESGGSSNIDDWDLGGSSSTSNPTPSSTDALTGGVE